MNGKQTEAEAVRQETLNVASRFIAVLAAESGTTEAKTAPDIRTAPRTAEIV